MVKSVDQCHQKVLNHLDPRWRHGEQPRCVGARCFPIQPLRLYSSIISHSMSLSVDIVFIIVTVCLLSAVNAPSSSRLIPQWCQILLGNKSASDSDCFVHNPQMFSLPS